MNSHTVIISKPYPVIHRYVCMPKLKESEPRSAKLTVLITQSTQDNLKALRAATFESTGDLVNRLLARELSEQADLVAEGQEIIRQDEARRQRIIARATPKERPPARSEASDKERPPARSEASEDEPSQVHPWPAITQENIDAWLKDRNPSDHTRCRNEAKSLQAWIAAAKPSEATLEAYEKHIWATSSSEKTAKNHIGMIRGLYRFIAGPLERF